jgi:hypothetical protein
MAGWSENMKQAPGMRACFWVKMVDAYLYKLEPLLPVWYRKQRPGTQLLEIAIKENAVMV